VSSMSFSSSPGDRGGGIGGRFDCRDRKHQEIENKYRFSGKH